MKFSAIALAFLGFVSGASALDLMEGRMIAVPAPEKVTIDGRFDEWDRSGEEWIAISEDVANRFSGKFMVMYDADALYIGAEVLTGGGKMINHNKPGEKPWTGHDIEFRCIAAPDAPFPLKIAENSRKHPSVAAWADRINTLTIWEETITHTPHITIVKGPPYDAPEETNLVDPPDVKLCYTQLENPSRYLMEARIPWSVLGVKDGKNPFKPGQAMTAFWTIMWPQGVAQRAEGLRVAPTAGFGWAWHHVHDWGKIEFSPEGKLPERNPSLAEYLESRKETPKSDSFTVDMPEKGLLSVNIVDKDGQILREIAGGEAHDKGPVRLYWDGYDWYGNPMPPGEYEYRAYVHKPLQVVYEGAAGTSAKVAYETDDRKGNWGGNMGPPTSVAAAKDGLYLLWGCNEGGHSIVKTDYNCNVQWRNTPYVIAGGYGPHVSIAVNSKYVYVLSGWFNNFITRYDAATGLTAHFGKQRFLALEDFGKTPPQQLDWNMPMPSASAIAVSETEIFVPFHYRGAVRVYDAETGEFKRELKIDWPRAVTLDENGNLYAVTGRDSNGWHPDKRYIWKSEAASAPFQRKFMIPLRNPWGLAVKGNRIFVSDNGFTNQVLCYENGKPAGAVGTYGGRAFAGAYDSRALLFPAGLALDADNQLWIAESAMPNLFQSVDSKTFQVRNEWFGETGYCPPAWPDCDNPREVYVKEYFTNGVIRSTLKGDGSSGGADAYWDFRNMDWPGELKSWTMNYRIPYIFRGPNNVKYTYATALGGNPATLICMNGTALRPAASLTNLCYSDAVNGGLRVWTDFNGDGKIDYEKECTVLSSLAGTPMKGADGKLWEMGASTVLPDGTLYLVGSDNAAYQIPLKKAHDNGALEWDWEKARCAVRGIVPFLDGKRLVYTARETIVGIDVDAEGTMYFSFTANLPYANKRWADRLRFGLAHTGRYNAVKVTVFNKDGTRRFLAGRKALGVLGDGEMYHHWAQAGVIGTHYMAVASEWTPFTIYTSDGFFVQTLLADPNKGETPSPYSLGGGETFSGRLCWYPGRGCWIYTGNTHGMVYRVDGFGPDGRITGEKRFSGKMTLTKNIDPFAEEEAKQKVVFSALKDPFTTGEWGASPVQINDNSGNKLAQADFAHDAECVYARFRVRTKNTFRNGADDPAMAFKQGDCVGFYLGNPEKHETPEKTDIRLLGTVFRGNPVVIAMFPEYSVKQPYEYFTTAGGRWKFDFAGILPEAKARFTKTEDGYIFEMAVPKKALPAYSWKPGSKIAVEAEVLLSGNGVRGLQAISRNHLFTPRSAGQAKMVDDIPSEARIYPKYHEQAEIQ